MRLGPARRAGRGGTGPGMWAQFGGEGRAGRAGRDGTKLGARRTDPLLRRKEEAA